MWLSEECRLSCRRDRRRSGAPVVSCQSGPGEPRRSAESWWARNSNRGEGWVIVNKVVRCVDVGPWRGGHGNFTSKLEVVADSPRTGWGKSSMADGMQDWRAGCVDAWAWETGLHQVCLPVDLGGTIGLLVRRTARDCDWEMENWRAVGPDTAALGLLQLARCCFCCCSRGGPAGLMGRGGQMPNGKTRRAAVPSCQCCLAQWMFAGRSNALGAGLKGRGVLFWPTSGVAGRLAFDSGGVRIEDGQIPGGQCRMDAECLSARPLVFVLG